MQIENSGSNDSQGGASSEGASTQVPATPASGQGGVEGASSGVVGGDGVTGEGSAFVPSLKYKVFEKEKEFPEWIKPFVTSPEIEKNLRETFEKSDGLDIVKDHRERLKLENKQLREHVSTYTPVVESAQQAYTFLENKDYHSFFRNLQIPDQDIFRYAMERLDAIEKGTAPVQDRLSEITQHNMQLQNQYNQLLQQNQNFTLSQRESELNGFLSRQDIAPIVSSFEARVGNPGVFKDEVIRRGQMYAAKGVDISVEQAVSEVLQLINWNQMAGAPAETGGLPPAQSQSQAGGNQQLGNGVVVPGARKQTIPSVKSNGTSPVKTMPKNLDDLRKLAKLKAMEASRGA